MSIRLPSQLLAKSTLFFEDSRMTPVAEARHRQILEAAAACFSRRGFHQATMQDICAEVGLSPGSVYRYFRSKDELIAALVEADRATHIARIEAVREEPDLFVAFQALADQTLDSLDDPQKRPLIAEITAETQRNPHIKELVRRSDMAILDSLAQTLRLAQEHGAIDPDLDPRATAEFLIAVVDGLSWRKSLYPERDAARDANLIRTMLSRFLRPGRAEPHDTACTASPSGKE
jgi:AcrR family transcriptional regulator